MIRLTPLLLLLCASCNLAARFTVEEMAPTVGKVKVSTVGLIRRGRFDDRAWEDVGPMLATALGPKLCELGFSDRLQDEDEALYAKLDAEAKDNGASRELLEAMAPRATGDLVAVFSMAGKPPPHSKRPSVHDQTTAQPLNRQRRGRRLRQLMDDDPESMDALQISVVIYSVARKETVLTIGLRYTGDNAEDGIKQFAQKIVGYLPDASCGDWKWKEDQAR